MDGLQVRAAAEGRGADALEGCRQCDGGQAAVALEGVLQRLHALELPEVIERGDGGVAIEDALDTLCQQVGRREEMALVGQCPRHGILSKGAADVLSLAGQLRVAQVVAYLRLQGIDLLDGSLPRVVPYRTVSGEALGEQHQFVDAVEVL